MMLKLLRFHRQSAPNLSHATKDKILAGVGYWRSFLELLDDDNEVKMEALEESFDEKVRDLAEIDQKLADLYLRCQSALCYSKSSY